MKKIIIASAVVLTTGLLTTLTKNSNVKAEKVTKVELTFNKTAALATAD